MLNVPPPFSLFFFFFNDTATTEIYTLSLHDALPILFSALPTEKRHFPVLNLAATIRPSIRDRKSTRLNSSHTVISYAVFCLKKKKLFLLNQTADTKTDIVSHPFQAIRFCRIDPVLDL